MSRPTRNNISLDKELSAQPRRQIWHSVGICLFLVLAVWVVFGQTRHFEFVNFDDGVSVYENLAVNRGWNADSVPWAFTHTLNSNWHPLTTLSHILDCQLYGMEAGRHHLTSVMIHALTVVLFFLMLQNLTGARWRSAFVAAVFAIHPLRAESVAWVSERKDVLSGLFFVLTVCAYVAYVRGRRSFYCLAVAFFVLGLMSKPMLVTVPFVLLLLDHWPLNRWSKESWLRLILEKFPFLLLSMVDGIGTLMAQRKAAVAMTSLSFPIRVGNALNATVMYFAQTIYPAGLAAFYPHPGKNLSYGTVALSVLFLITFTFAVLKGRKKYPFLIVGWLWYLIMLAPVLGLIQVGAQTRADRYTYLPQIGLIIMVAWGTAELCKRRVILGAAATAVVGALMMTAYVQTQHWKNSFTLWTHALACTSKNVFAHNNLGLALSDQGKWDEAMRHFQLALELQPEYAESHNNLANGLMRQGLRAEAISHYELSLRSKPDFAQAWNNLGNALGDEGRLVESVAKYQQALQLKPDYAEAHKNLGGALARQGKSAEAMAQFEQALQLKPNYAQAHVKLATALVDQGRLDEAVAHYEKALQLNPDSMEARNNLANVLSRQGKLEEAIQNYQKSLQLNPASAETHYNFALALAGQGKAESAVQHFQQAAELAAAQNKPQVAEVIRQKLEAYQLSLPAK